MADNLDYSGNDEKKGKSGIEHAQNAKNKVDKGRKLLNAAKGISELAPLVTIISTIGIILLIIFLAIGYIAFFETLPGLFVDEVKEIAEGFWTWLIGDETVEIDAGEINDLARYIEDMGYDVGGYGFAKTTNIDRTDGLKILSDDDIKENDPAQNKQKSNLYAYVLASERTYAVSGVNINKLALIGKALPIVHYFINEAERNDKYEATDPMICFEDLSLSEKAKIDVTIDRPKEQMIVDTGYLFKDRMTYSLTNFTSKYGKPIELTLALHLSTMAPDFVYDFCMDEDLITKVSMGMTKLDLEDIEYTYEINGNVITYDEVVEAWNKIHSEEFRSIKNTYVRSEEDWRKYEYGKENQDSVPTIRSNFIAPFDTMFDTNIFTVYAVMQGDNIRNAKMQRAVYKDGTTVKLDDSNYRVKHTVKYDKDGIYFEKDNNGRELWSWFFEGILEGENNPSERQYNYITTIEDSSLGNVGDKIYIKSEVVSLNGLMEAVRGGNYRNSFGATGTMSEFGESNYDGIKKQTYINLFNGFDKAMNSYLGNNEADKEICKKFKMCKDLDDLEKNTFTSWSEENKNTFKHNSEDIFGKIMEYSLKHQEDTDKVDKLLKNFAVWVQDECKVYDENSAKILQAEIPEVKTLFDKGLKDIDEIDVLLICLEPDKSAESYEPYVKSVTHHWRKDLYFEDNDENWSVYENSKTKSLHDQFDASDIEGSETLAELKERGRFYYSATGTGGLNQRYEPKIVTDEPWHYKIKNWLAYGYFFIYDGTVETAKEIEKARGIIQKEVHGEEFNKDMMLYDTYNPLLLEKYREANKNEDTQKNLYESGISSADVKEIDQKAEQLNNVLKVNDCKVRLERIKFDKNPSLTAFSILEAVHNEDADYIYGELKELLIEMGYFTKEDFDSIETDVLEWLIPDYPVYKGEWPDLKYEKLNMEYGTFIRSKISIDTQRSEEEEKLNADSSKTRVSSSQYINQNASKDFLATAKKCWEYIIDNSDRIHYNAVGIDIPVTDKTTTIDCSAYVSWVIYEHGYSDFKGHQHTSSTLMNENYFEKFGWSEYTGNGDCSSVIKPGDIVVRPDHVTIVKSIESNGTVMAYNCGDESHLNKANREKGINQTGFIKQAGQYKVIRITNKGTGTTSAAFKLDKNSSNTTTTAGVEVTKVNASDYGEEGYCTVTTVNGISYKDYKQGSYYGAKDYMQVSSQYSQINPSNSSCSFGDVGCGPTSASIILSAYGITGKTGTDALPYRCGELAGTHTGGTNDCTYLKKAFDNYGVSCTVHTLSNRQVDMNIMDEAFKAGKPILINETGAYYSGGSGHYIAALGYDSNNKVVISNPCGFGIYGTESAKGGIFRSRKRGSNIRTIYELYKRNILNSR